MSSNKQDTAHSTANDHGTIKNWFECYFTMKLVWFEGQKRGGGEGKETEVQEEKKEKQK